MELFPYIFSQFVHCWCIEKLMLFVSWFCILDTLLQLFMVSRSFWVDFFVSLRYRIMSSTNKDVLTVSLPICVPFISLSCLIALARNSSTMLNRSGDSGHPYLIPDFRWNGFSFSPLSMMLSYIAFIMLRYLYHEVVLDFVEGFFCIYWDDQVVFVFASINVLYYIYRFDYVEPPLHPWYEANLIMVNDLSIFCWIQFAIVLLRIFASTFIKEIGL
jgi:hypothetical protein